MGKSTNFYGQPVERWRHVKALYYGFNNNLITLVKGQVKRSWTFSNPVSIIRQQLMDYINIYAILEDPGGSWREII